MPSNASTIPAIPTGLSGDALIRSINDKLRRIAVLTAGISQNATSSTTSVTISSGGVASLTVLYGTAPTIDLLGQDGAGFVLVLTAAAVTFGPPVTSIGSISVNQTFKLYLDMDATGGRNCPAFTGGANGFASDTQARILNLPFDGTPLTRTSLLFTFHGSVWVMDAGSSGAATT